MRKNELILDKFSVPQHHTLFVGMQVFGFTEKEIHVNTLVSRVLKRRKTLGNINDEIRVLKAIGLLIGLGKLDYYRGFVYRK